MVADIRATKNLFPGMRSVVRQHAADTINGAIANFHRVAGPITPVDKGFLKSNTTIRPATPDHLAGTFTYNQNYAVYVHEGTRRQASQPWARNAANIVMPEFMSRMRSIPWEG